MNIKKILFILLAACTLCACGDDNDEPGGGGGGSHYYKGRTLLACLIANSNLSSYLRDNVVTLTKGLQSVTDSAAVIVYWDGTGRGDDMPWTTPCIVRYATAGNGDVNGHTKAEMDVMTDSLVIATGEVLKRYGDQVSTDAAVMKTVVADMIDLCPSDSYGLVMGSHGSSWLPTITGRSFGVDGDYTNTILIPEMAQTLSQALAETTAEKFDFIALDACMMGSAEVYYELRNVTKYALGSVQEIPDKGLPYRQIVPWLFETDIENYFQDICYTFINYYQNYEMSGGRTVVAWGSLTAMDCTQMDALATALRAVLLANEGNIKSVNVSALQDYGVRGYSGEGYTDVAYDMVQYVEELCGGDAPADFMNVFNQAVLCTECIATPGSNYTKYAIDADHYSGLSMFVPGASSTTSSVFISWEEYYKSSIAWFEAAGWAETESTWGE